MQRTDNASTSASSLRVTKDHRYIYDVMRSLLLPSTLLGAVLLTIATLYYLIQLRWSQPLASLFLPSGRLEPADRVMQLYLLGNTGMAFVAGGILAMVSVLLQQVVKNNLASDSTLAVGSGAMFAIVLGLLFFPSLAVYGSVWVAFAGAITALGIAVLIALPSQLNPLVLVLAGFVMSLFLASAVTLLMLFDVEYYTVLTLWSSGFIYQVSWQPLLRLSIISALVLPLLWLLHKPLMLMSLNDEQASRLGLSVTGVRLGIFVLCAFLTALVVSELGLIGFVGLGAATAVNALNIRDIRLRLLFGFVIGGLLLALTNNLVGIATYFLKLPMPLPAGVLTGVLGAPLVIWLILRQRKQPIAAENYDIVLKRQAIDWVLYSAVLVVLFVLALVYGQSSLGWHFTFNVQDIVQYRLGRSLGAMATGVLLALAGVVLQQMTRNPMASPEVLGISAAASISMVLAYLFIPTLSIIHVLGFGVLGSTLTLLLILWLMRRVHNSYLLLIGIAIGSLSAAMSVIIGFSRDPRLQTILNWLSGTTYHIHPQGAYILIGLAFVALAVSWLAIKPIKLLSLTAPVARGLGLSIKGSQTLLLIFVAVLSTLATVTVGPLSFIGLVVPQLARTLGAVQIEKQLPLSALLGAMMMLIADWIGRYIIFPYEIPAGLLAALIGGCYFLFMMRKFK